MGTAFDLNLPPLGLIRIAGRLFYGEASTWKNTWSTGAWDLPKEQVNQPRFVDATDPKNVNNLPRFAIDVMFQWKTTVLGMIQMDIFFPQEWLPALLDGLSGREWTTACEHGWLGYGPVIAVGPSDIWEQQQRLVLVDETNTDQTIEGQVAFSFPPPSQLEPLLPEMDDDEEKEGRWGRWPQKLLARLFHKDITI